MIAHETFLGDRPTMLPSLHREYSRVDGISEDEFGKVAAVPDESRHRVKHFGLGRRDSVLLIKDDTQGGVGRFTF